MELYTNGWINKTLWYYIMHEDIPYIHQRWNHFCLIYSISKEASWLYHNGQLISNLTISDDTVYGYKFKKVIPSSSEAYDSSFIVGQEPDSMRGSFNEKQAYSGDIFGLNIWDRILSSRDIESMYSCLRRPKGNIIEWNVSKWKKNKVQISENASEQICRFGLDVKGKDDESFLLIHNGLESIAYIGPKDVGDFEIIEVTDDISICEKHIVKVNSSLSIPELLLCIRIKRSHADQVVSIFCPLILFWLLAYFTLFLDIHDVSNRSRTSVTLLLVYIALLQTVKREFPKTTYYKFIDIWFLWYVVNTFFISLYHIISPRFLESQKRKNITLSKTEESQKKPAWTEALDQHKVKENVKKLDLILVISLPLLMIILNSIYFTMTR